MNGKSILIVDDNPDIQNLLQRYFGSKGFATFVASDGNEAFSVLENSNFIDLIFLDSMMEGMNGISFLKAFKKSEQYKDTRVCFLTALRDKPHVVNALKLGADDYIVKPVDFATLRDRVRKLINIDSEPEFCVANVDWPVSVPMSPFDVDIVMTEMSETDFVLKASIKLKSNASFPLFCLDLANIVGDKEFKPTFFIREVIKEKNHYVGKGSFIGLKERDKAAIRKFVISSSLSVK